MWDIPNVISDLQCLLRFTDTPSLTRRTSSTVFMQQGVEMLNFHPIPVFLMSYAAVWLVIDTSSFFVNFFFPVYLTVSHKWLCRREAHMLSAFSWVSDLIWEINPCSENLSWLLHCSWPWGGRVLCSEQTWLNVLLSRHPYSSSWCVSVTVGMDNTDCFLNGCVVSRAKLKSPWKYDTGPKQIDITVPSAACPCLAFVCLHFLLLRKHMHFPKHSSFLSKAGLGEDRLRLQIMHECSWLSSCDVCSSSS